MACGFIDLLYLSEAFLEEKFRCLLGGQTDEQA